MTKEQEHRLAERMNVKPKNYGKHTTIELSFNDILELIQDRKETGYPEVEVKIGNRYLHIINSDSPKRQKVYERVAKDTIKDILNAEEYDEIRKELEAESKAKGKEEG